MKNNLFKKSIAVVMTALMLMTCWVFMPATHEHFEAEALATVDTYRQADKYGTPYWDGSDVYYSRWNSGGSYTTVKWAKHIYLDISETLQSAGYYYDIEWYYGSGTDYRIINNGFIFGGYGIGSGWPDNYYTMTNMFNNYSLDGSLSNGGTQQTSNVTDGDLFIGVSGLDWDGAKTVIFRSRQTTNNEKVFMLGTPKAVGTGRYSTSGNKPTSFGGWQQWKSSWGSSKWTSASDKYTKDNNSSNWTTDCYEGEWKEVAFDITIYDKSTLSATINEANNIINNLSKKYTVASLNNLKTVLNNNKGVLTTRATTQDNINTANTNIRNAINSLVLQEYTVQFDNLFNYSNFTISGNLTVNDRTDTGFTVTSTAGDGNTGFSNVIPVEPGKTYIFSADVDFDNSVGGDGYDMYIHTLDANQAGETTATPDTSNGAHREGNVYISLTGQTTNKTPYIRFTAGDNTKYIKIRFDANNVGNVLTVNNIRVYEDGKVADGTSYVASKSYYYDSAIGTLPVPTRTGYTFNGWVDANGNAVSSTTTIIDNVTFYSTWGANTYTIKFDANGGSGTMADLAMNYGEAKNLTANAFKKTGYSFVGWSLSSDATSVDYTNGESVKNLATSGTVTLYAKWSKVYTVTFYYGDNTSVFDVIEVNEGATLGSLPQSTPTKASTDEYEYKFDHWYANGDKFDENTVITSHLSVYPEFKNNSHGNYGFEYKTAATCESNAMVIKYCGNEGCDHVFNEGNPVLYEASEDADAENHKAWLAKGHSYTGDAIPGTDDVHYIKCARYNTCGSTIEEAHSWDGSISQGATCVTPGTIKKICSVCYAEKYVDGDVDLTNHVNTSVINVQAADCENDGYTGDTYCNDCKTTVKAGTVIPRLGHLDANNDHVCDRGCGIAQGTCSDSETDGDHLCDYGCGKVLEDCSDEANDGDHKCDICDKDNVTEHIKGEETKENIKEATCGSAGKYDSVYYCTECNAVVERINDVTIAQKPHNWQSATYSWSNDGKSCTATHVCANNAEHTESETVNATGTQKVAPTCETMGSTLYTADFEATWAETKTNEVYDIPANGHTPATAVIENNTPATCTTDGSYDTVIYCSVKGCNKQLSRVTTTVPAKGHTAGAAATCTTAQTCTVCGEVLVEALKHDYRAEVTAPTCTEGGYTTYTCTKCNDTYTADEVGKLGHTPGAAATCTTAQTCTVCGEVLVEALKHDYKAEVTAPTCTEDGYTTYTCTKCNDTYTDDTVAALGHTWVDATCTTPKTCSVCDATEGEALGHDWADATCTAPKTCSVCDATEGEALGHDWADATCTAPKTCSVCDATEGEALGHTWVDATCTTPKTCSVCDATEGKANGHAMTDFGYTVPTKVELPEGTVIAEPTCKKDGLAISYCETEGCTYYDTMVVARDKDAHNWSEETKGEGNCTTGVTFYTECSYCGTKTVTRVEVVPHELVLVAYEPANCTTEEIRYYVCSVCGYGEEEHIGEALGHDWAKDVIEKEATCGQTGRKYSICSRCNTASEKVEIPRLGHVWEEEGFNYAEYMEKNPNANILYVEASDATCTYEGYNGYYKCFSCSYDQHLDEAWRQNNVIAVKAHEDKDGDNKCDDCNAKLYGDDSNSACGCICHKENWFSKLIYKILCFFWKLFGIGKSCECGTVHY